jgi:tetratricopeptide (TPR) repeat protein
MKILLGILFLLAPAILLGQTNDLQNMANLAGKYYQDKEFSKAAELYEQLYLNTKSESYFSIYFDCLLGISDYEKAEKAIKKGIRGNSSDSFWYVQWGFLKKTEGKLDESDKMYNKAITSTSNPVEYPNLANQFITRREYEYAAKVYLKARSDQNQNQQLYNYELARIYFYMRNYDQMLNEYIEWIKQKESNLDIVKSSLQSVLSMDNDGEISKQMKTFMLKHIQQDPGQLIYNRLLIWLFIQDKNFVAAIRQSIALDKRTGQENAAILELANISASNKYFEDAAKAYDYLIGKGKNSDYYRLASQQLMYMSYDRFVDEGITDLARTKELQNQFNQTFTTLGISSDTSGLLIKYAHLLAFYLNLPDEALKTLTEGLAMAGLSIQQISAIKAELSDIYVFTGDFGDAVITYSQVIESNKNNPIGDDIKLKKAKLGYYMGNFRWAKAQLNALRASTSKLIANDAMELSLFINDNLESDSLATPIEIFARADLQLFRRNFSGALAALDSVASLYPDNSLVDDVNFRKAAILQHQGKYAEAATLYSSVVQNYSWDMLADDALFQLALIYENKLNRKPEAMDLFKKILTDYPGSIYVVDARAEYRKIQALEDKTQAPNTSGEK